MSKIEGKEVAFARKGKCIDCGTYATVYHTNGRSHRSCGCSKELFAVVSSNGKVLLSRAADRLCPLGEVEANGRLVPVGTSRQRAKALDLL